MPAVIRTTGNQKPKMSWYCHRTENLTLAAGLISLPICSAPSSLPAQESQESASAVQGSSTSLWEQQYMFGDWGGERSWLAKRGVTFDFSNIGDFQGDVTGGQTHHIAYFGRFRASTDIDFKKLADFDGEFFSSGLWQYGQNLSGRYLRVNTLVSSIAGEDTARLDQFWYQQGFFNHLFTVKLGQVAAVNEFGATDFFDILFND
jgi:porin